MAIRASITSWIFRTVEPRGASTLATAPASCGCTATRDCVQRIPRWWVILPDYRRAVWPKLRCAQRTSRSRPAGPSPGLGLAAAMGGRAPGVEPQTAGAGTVCAVGLARCAWPPQSAWARPPAAATRTAITPPPCPAKTSCSTACAADPDEPACAHSNKPFWPRAGSGRGVAWKPNSNGHRSGFLRTGDPRVGPALTPGPAPGVGGARGAPPRTTPGARQRPSTADSGGGSARSGLLPNPS